MKKLLSAFIVLTFIGCGREFEPDLSGSQAYTTPPNRLHLVKNERETVIELPGDETINYRFAQWTKSQNILLVQMKKTEQCRDYQIISIDTTGVIIDTVYTAPPNTALNFKIAPNDSLLLVKTYEDNCDESDYFTYSFYNRHLKKTQYDTIHSGNTQGVPLLENIWSPDSKNVIIAEWSMTQNEAYTYNLATKDTTYIGIGNNFVWSPIDNNLVAYIKGHSIYTKNIKTKKEELIYEGRKKKSVYGFRWNPTGDFLMIHIQGYVLNLVIPKQTIIYYSLKDKTESETYHDSQRVDTWR